MNRNPTSVILQVFLLMILVISTFGCINLTIPNATTDNTDTKGTKYSPPTRTFKEAPTIESFTASSEKTLVGGTKTLSWSVKNADSIMITPGIGNVPSTGSKSVLVNAATTYTLVASNANGMKSESLIVAPIEIINIQPGKVVTKSGETKKPDLVAQSLSDNGAKHPWYLLKNAGEANSVPCKNILYMDGIKMAEDNIDIIIPPGVEITRVIYGFKYTDALEAHRWEIKADFDNKNDESNEDNNAAAIIMKWK